MTAVHSVYSNAVHNPRYLHAFSQYESCPASSVRLDVFSRNVFMAYSRGYFAESEFIPHGKYGFQSPYLLSSSAIA